MQIASSHVIHRRRSRWSRDGYKHAQIGAADIEVFKLLSRHRYLRSDFIHAFVGGDKTRLLERLGLLYRSPNRYIDRPHQQRQHGSANQRPLIYELSGRGAQVLEDAGHRDHGLIAWLRRGEDRVLFAHAVMTCDVLASIDLGVRNSRSLRFLSWREIASSPRFPQSTRALKKPFFLPCTLTHRNPRTGELQQFDAPFMPDALFGLEYLSGGQKTWRFFALEADRGTEPVARASLRQTSYLKKIMQYRDAVDRGTHRSHWGLPNLIVLTVTNSEARMRNIMQFVHSVTNGAGCAYLLFKAMPTLGDFKPLAASTGHMLSQPWQRVGLQPLDISKP